MECHQRVSEAIAICVSVFSIVSKVGTILVHLCITHSIWNSALGISSDQKILVGVDYIARCISKQGW